MLNTLPVIFSDCFFELANNPFSEISHYQQNISAFGTPYVRPQEHSNHMKIRTINFTDRQSQEISITGNALNISAYPYSIKDLEGSNQISFQEVGSGIFFIKVYTTTGQVSSFKVVKEE